MTEYLSKKALLEWLEKQRKEMESECEIDREGAYLDVIEEIQSGVFDADESEGTWKATAEVLGRENAQMNSEIQRLRAALEKAKQYVMNGYELGYIDDREGYTEALVREIDEALSTTTEPTGAERVREIDEILALHSEKIAHHRQSGDIKSEYFYRGYNAALRMERNRYTSGINAPEGDGNDA